MSVDPIIAAEMNFELDDAVVIFDEAHNMEDACREAGSFTFSLLRIQETLEHLQHIRTRTFNCSEAKQNSQSIN